jgi:hypothetical protein
VIYRSLPCLGNEPFLQARLWGKLQHRTSYFGNEMSTPISEGYKNSVAARLYSCYDDSNAMPYHRPGEDQWAQCDDCGSWRKVPSNVFLPTRWVCAENVWDAQRFHLLLFWPLENSELHHIRTLFTFICKALNISS